MQNKRLWVEIFTQPQILDLIFTNCPPDSILLVYSYDRGLTSGNNYFNYNFCCLKKEKVVQRAIY